MHNNYYKILQIQNYKLLILIDIYRFIQNNNSYKKIFKFIDLILIWYKIKKKILTINFICKIIYKILKFVNFDIFNLK